jgi:hypothetical protein
MSRYIRRIMLVLCVSLEVSSCAGRACDDYRHLAFGPTEGMVPVETRVPALSGLRDVKPFPVKYVLERESYRIVARAYEKDFSPAATLSVEAEAPMSLKVASIGTDTDGASCIVQVEQGGGVIFSWGRMEGCAATGKISIEVINASGDQIAHEELTFDVITNGRFCLNDGL